jgi:hypothetical protein
VRGVNWDYGPIFGTAVSRFGYTTPMTVRMSFGDWFYGRERGGPAIVAGPPHFYCPVSPKRGFRL